MQIVRAHAFGTPENLVVEDIAPPEPGPGEVRIATRAIGVNPVDWKLLTGKAPVNPPLPLVPGGDVAGLVDALGEGVTEVAIGDRVMALIGLTGAYAQAVVTKAAHLAPIPPALSFAEAAGLPLVALTAWQGFAADGRDLAGLDVLVHNGAGGVGNAAIQIARARGARVTATASAANADFVRALGAGSVVDPRAGEVPGPCDVLIDLVGNSLETGLWAHVREGGSVIRIAGGADAPACEERDRVRAYKVRVKPDGAGLRALADLAARGLLRTTIAQEFPLSAAAEALGVSKSGHVRGKLVLV
jgi:NADPH:quinone reductase-like Zn-dependent oxidoreductase